MCMGSCENFENPLQWRTWLLLLLGLVFSPDSSVSMVLASEMKLSPSLTAHVCSLLGSSWLNLIDAIPFMCTLAVFLQQQMQLVYFSPYIHWVPSGWFYSSVVLHFLFCQKADIFVTMRHSYWRPSRDEDVSVHKGPAIPLSMYPSSSRIYRVIHVMYFVGLCDVHILPVDGRRYLIVKYKIWKDSVVVSQTFSDESDLL